VLSRSDGTGTRGVLRDGLGSVLALVDSAGVVQTQYTYEPFGATTTSGQANANPSQYTGRENDGTGLYFYRARYYHPVLQRFISEDPLGFAGGDANLYAYVFNSPTNLTDPSGAVVPPILTLALIRCLSEAGQSVGFAAAANILSGRKTTMSGLLREAAIGCLLGIIAGNWGHVIRGTPEIAVAADDALRFLRGACSFGGDMVVATEAGPQPISGIHVGDRVLAYDEATGETGYYTVTAVHRHDDETLEYLTVDGERIVTTPEHPFYAEGRGWTAAGDLTVGDRVRRADGTYGAVQATATAAGPRPMYNLTVATAHTFFVGDKGWLVHNACPIHRPLTVADLGAKGVIEELAGTFSVSGGTATVRVDMIRGRITNPFQILENLMALARSHGATTLRIEGTLANETLMEILQRRYGLQTAGGTDFIEITLK
jgi:RHS repeat-associated protein